MQVAHAQGNLGGLTGSIRDESGASLPDVQLTLRNVATNQAFTTTSSEAGYSFTALPPGSYRLEAEKAGFKKFVQESLDVLTATAGRLDISMSLGQVTESVTVSGDALMLQTSSPEVGTVLSRKTLLDLPIQVGGSAATTAASGRRQPETFIFLTPGVTGIPWSKNINGSPNFTQELLIDGVSAQLPDTVGFLAQTSPPYEAVEEFKVQNSLFPAEFGRGLGVINYTLKSGTNRFHGGLFEFLRNDKLDARGFFPRVRPPVRFNEYGGNIGGPVILPKIYNGRNRTFFNFNYTGLRNGPPINGTLISVPDAAFRRGDFSNYRDNSGNLIPIFDPATTQPDGTRTPFPGNIIPPDRISAVARNAIALIPAPDLPGYQLNYVNRTANPVRDDIWSLKVDQILSEKHHFSWSYWDSVNDQDVNSVFGAAGGEYGRLFRAYTPGNNHRVNWHHTVRPTLLQHFAFGYTFAGPTRQVDTRRGNEIIRLPGIPAESPGFPTFNIRNNYGALEIGNSNQQPVDPTQKRNIAFIYNLTWIKGIHQLKFGADIRRFQYNEYLATNLSGQFFFDPLSTSSLTAPNFTNLGNGWASFLLGQVSSGNRFFPADTRRMRSEYYAFYVDDVLKVTPRLTVTLGLRYDIPTVLRDVESRNSVLDLDAPNPAAGGRPGALRFIEKGEMLTDNFYKAFAPRVGVAYTLGAKTVVRAGYGIFYSGTNATSIGRAARFFSHGFSFDQSFPQLTGNRLPAFVLDEGVPSTQVSLPNTNPSLMNGATIDFMNPGAGKPGYVNSWTFNIQRELPGQILLDAGYVGQRGVNLPSGLENLNQLDVQYLSLGNLLNADINSPAAIAAGIQKPFESFTVSVAQALRPYPQFANINNYFQPTGWSTYHSLQVRTQKRYSNGASFLIAYTLSKNVVWGGGYSGLGDDAANSRPLDTRNPGLEKRLSAFDQPHIFIFSGGYELPVGRGRQFLGESRGLVNALVGGWMLNGIFRYSSGTPIGISGGPNLPIFNGGNRPNRVPGVNPLTGVSGSDFDQSSDLYLNVAAFSQPAAFTFGNAAANYGDIRTFPFINEDFSVLKDIAIVEGHRLQFRAEAFNVLNRVVFGSPGSNINAPANFGRIGSQANSPRSIQLALKYMF
ncbi:MAG TPA: TonB-dependent receptor [Bryobacteraceae bacterium]|nr:TonB-dependent receptor [Bryobacteraceae bacterium]